MGRHHPLIGGHPDARGGRQASPLKAGLACRCPRCGHGRLYAGFLRLADRCEVCGLELGKHDTGDGPAVFLIFIIGLLVVPLAIWVDFAFLPSLWLHAALWPLVILALALLLLRPSKALLVALQYRHRREDFEDDRPAHGP